MSAEYVEPAPMTAYDCEPLPDESRLCTRCEHGHGGHVCRWCVGRQA